MHGIGILSEYDRNRILRRADWRFLLNEPRPERTVCLTDGNLALAARLISKSVAEQGGAENGDCDLAMAVNPGTVALRSAFEKLRAGGSCYTEWYSLRTRGPRRVRRLLEVAGFVDVNCYWAWPWPKYGPARVWLPLEAPGAERYWRRQLVGGGPSHRIKRMLFLLLWRLGVIMGLTLPICATARKPGSGTPTGGDGGRCQSEEPEAAAADALDHSIGMVAAIREAWPTWDLGPPPQRISTLLLTGGPRSISKIVSLMFSEPESVPRLVVKMPRVAESLPGLRREAATLRAIEKLDTGRLFPGIPRVLFCRDVDCGYALGETALMGQSIFTILHRDNYREIALQATDWLTEFALHTRKQGRPGDVPAFVNSVLQHFVNSFGSVIDSTAIETTYSIFNERLTLELPCVCEQRDFSPWNVFRGIDDQLVVLDWESAELHGLPVMDLIYFLTNLAFFIDRAYVFSPKGALGSGRFRESYQAILDPTTFTGSIFQECIARYCRRLKLDYAALQPLRMLVWLLHSRSEHEQFIQDCGGTPKSGALRRSLFLSLWEEELRHSSTR